MKEYRVTVPFAGHVELTIEAESEEEAKEAFWDLEIWNLEDAEVNGVIDTHTWEFHEKITQGNVLYADVNSMKVEEL